MREDRLASSTFARGGIAWCARAAVASGRHAALRVEGLEPTGSALEEMHLYESGGLPHLVCHTASAIAEAVGSVAVLTVRADLDPRRSAGRSAAEVVLSGRLRHAPHPQPRSAGEVTLTLRLEEVCIELSGGPLPAVQACIDPAGYLNAAVDTFQHHSLLLAGHLNHDHAAELRDGAARLAGIPVGEVVSASVDEVTRTSATLCWIDSSGAHRRNLIFRRTADDGAALDHLLREQIFGA